MGVRNLPKVLTRQQPGRKSNPVSAIHKSDAADDDDDDDDFRLV